MLLLYSIGFSIVLAEGLTRIVRPQNLSGSWRVATDRGLMVNKSGGEVRHQQGQRVANYSFGPGHLRGPVGKGKVKILVLGDSYTFGWLLKDEDTYVYRIQQSLDAAWGNDQVILLNAAAGGWGTADSVAFVEDFGDKIAPDMVVVFLNTDDIGRALRSDLWTFDAESEKIQRKDAPFSRLKRMANSIPLYGWLLEHRISCN